MPDLPFTRKIPCALGALLLLAASLLATAPTARAARRPEIAAAAVSQAGRDLVLTVRTARPEPLARLQALPLPAIRLTVAPECVRS